MWEVGVKYLYFRWCLPLLEQEEEGQKEGQEEEGENPLHHLQKKEVEPGCPILFPPNPLRRKRKEQG